MSLPKEKKWKKFFALNQNFLLKHPFYQKSNREQTKIQIFIAAIAFVVILISLLFSWLFDSYLLSIFTISVVLSIIAPFLDAPSMKKSGKLIYCSNLLLMEKPQKGTIKIHGGSLFDYAFVLDKKMSGKQRTNFIIHQYLEGLLYIIEEYENGNMENHTIKGTSYILKNNTLQKIGFEIIETDFIQKVILIFNFFNLLISKTIAKGKLSFPNLLNIHTYQIKISLLKEHKEYIKTLHAKLNSMLAI